MKRVTALLVWLTAVALVQADPAIESVQQTLKEQGFYYGEITGEKNADTTAAIRRYQIRNGLQVTGELNDETLRSLRSAPPPSPPPVTTTTPAPAPTPDTSDLRDYSTSTGPAPQQSPFPPVPQDRQFPFGSPNAPPIRQGNLFSGTPYEASPPDVQRSVVVFAQRALARRGLYRNQIDGVFGSALEFSLRAYQSRVGLDVTGRLDLATLAALELLPGANEPVYMPRRPGRPRPELEPPVRGEWIPD